jgi:hypothetical protein
MKRGFEEIMSGDDDAQRRLRPSDKLADELKSLWDIAQAQREGSSSARRRGESGHGTRPPRPGPSQSRRPRTTADNTGRTVNGQVDVSRGRASSEVRRGSNTGRIRPASGSSARRGRQ